MKKHLAVFTIVCAIFGTSALSAESYWEAFKSHFPGVRDYLPSFVAGEAKTQEAKPANPQKVAEKPVAKKSAPAPKPVVAAKPVEKKPAPAPKPVVAAKPVAKKPAPAPKPVVAAKPVAKKSAPASKPVVAAKPVAKKSAPAPKPVVATKPVAKKPAPAPKPVVAAKPVAKKPAPAPKPVVAAKPVEKKPAPAPKPEQESPVVKKNTTVAAKAALPKRGRFNKRKATSPKPSASVDLNLRQGLEAVMEKLSSLPYVQGKKINRESLIGLVSFTKHMAAELETSAFNQYVNDLDQTVAKANISSGQTIPLVRAQLRKLAVIGASASSEQIKAAIMATLKESLEMTKDAKGSMNTVCSELCTCAIMLGEQDASLAKDFAELVKLSSACLKQKTKRHNLVQNIKTVLKRNQ